MKNIKEIREDFPILKEKINGREIVYFDNAATTQKPKVVIDSIVEYYTKYNANVHRGVHYLSQIATDKYEGAREKIREFVNARSSKEIIFTSGTTFGLNLIASCLEKEVKKGDEVWVLTTEHHSNIVPWQFLCEKTGAVLKNIPVNEYGEIGKSFFEGGFSSKMKVLSIQHISNALGNVHNVKELVRKAKEVGAITVVDGAQSVSHMKVDVQDMGMDFFVTSGHKMYAPTGIGFLYGREEMLNKIPPYQGGGDMIKTVCFAETTYADLPYKFEAGTPNICGGIALGVAIDYIKSIGIENIERQEKELLKYAMEKLVKVEGIEIYGSKNMENKAGVISFNIKGIHPYDVGVVLDKMGIAVRTGHHCAQPVLDFYKIPGTVRVSIGIYNTKEEVDYLVGGVEKAVRMLR